MYNVRDRDWPRRVSASLSRLAVCQLHLGYLSAAQDRKWTTPAPRTQYRLLLRHSENRYTGGARDPELHP